MPNAKPGHTAGPWRRGYDGDMVVIECGSLVLAEIQGTSAEDLANADVMAAGPEMLKALKNFIRDSDGCGMCAYCKAEAVVAKAEGRDANVWVRS